MGIDNRILMITGAMGIGGAEKVSRDIGLYCQEKGYQVDYLVFGDAVGEYEETLTGNGCEVIHIPSPAKGYYRFFQTLKRMMREGHYGVVHTHTMFNAGWAMLAAKQEGVPVRITHAHSALVNGKNLKKQVYELLMRRLILQNATHLVACGDAAGIRLFGAEAYNSRGIRILNGIDVERFSFNEIARERMRAELRVDNAFVVGHVGRLAAVKNQEFLIRLLPRILEKKQHAKLLLVGDGEDRNMLSRMARDQGLSEHVIMTGNVSNVQDYLSAMDVFAFPSLYEGMPLSIVEVQANGLPCILSTGVPKDVYLTDLMKPLSLQEPAAWVEAICKAVRHEPQSYMAEIKKQGLDNASVMKRYIKIYERADKID